MRDEVRVEAEGRALLLWAVSSGGAPRPGEEEAAREETGGGIGEAPLLPAMRATQDHGGNGLTRKISLLLPIGSLIPAMAIAESGSQVGRGPTPEPFVALLLLMGLGAKIVR